MQKKEQKNPPNHPNHADWTRHHHRFVLGTAVVSHKKQRSEGTSPDLIWPSSGPKAIHLNFCIQLPDIWTLFISGWRREQTGNLNTIRAAHIFFHLRYACTTKGTQRRVKRPAKTMQMLYKTTCLSLNEHRFTETSRRGPKRRSQSTQTVLQPYFGTETKAQSNTEPVQLSTLSPRALSHTEGPHKTKNFTSLAQTQKNI